LDRAVVDHTESICGLDRRAHVLLDLQNGHAVRGDSKTSRTSGALALRGLVEQGEQWVEDQGAGNREQNLYAEMGLLSLLGNSSLCERVLSALDFSSASHCEVDCDRGQEHESCGYQLDRGGLAE